MSRPLSQYGIPFNPSVKGRGRLKTSGGRLDRFNERAGAKILHATKGWRSVRDIEVDYFVSQIQQQRLAQATRRRPAIHVETTHKDERVTAHRVHRTRSKYTGARLRFLREMRGVGRPPRD